MNDDFPETLNVATIQTLTLSSQLFHVLTALDTTGLQAKLWQEVPKFLQYQLLGASQK